MDQEKNEITCKKCKNSWDLREFYKNGVPRAPFGRCQHCVKYEREEGSRTQRIRILTEERYAAKVKESRAKSARKSALKKYGITPEDYERMFFEQEGKCQICLGDNKGRNLCVDHDHKTGKVRGLLCTNCNSAIGQMLECKESIFRAIKYLNKYGK